MKKIIATIAFVLFTTSAFSYSCPMLWGEVDELLKTAKDNGKTAAQIEEVQTLRDKGKKAHDEMRILPEHHSLLFILSMKWHFFL